MDGEREKEKEKEKESGGKVLEANNNKVRESNWFEEGGRSICFRGKTVYGPDEPWYLFTIPADCVYQCFILQQQQTLKNNNNNDNKKKKKRKSSSFNHSLRHTFPLDFLIPHEPVPQKFAGLYDASWVVLGSTFYFFGSTNRKIYYLNRNAADATVPASLTLKKAGRMITKRKNPKVVALDGKIYVFSREEHLWGEVFQPYTGSFEGQSQALFQPIPSHSYCDVTFVVAIEKERQIVVGFNCTLVGKKSVRDLYPDIEETTGLSVHVYDVGSKEWEEHGNTLYLNHRTLHCQPIAVGSCLYWLDKKMRAYDLNTRQYYEGPIEDCFLQHLLETSKNPKYLASLLHLFGDFFCITWCDGDELCLHCTTIQALRTTTNLQANNRFELHISVVSCQTIRSSLSPFIQCHALVL